MDNGNDASVTVRLPRKVKDDAADVCEGLGLDLPSVTRAFYCEIARTGRVPLNLSMDPFEGRRER